MSFCDWVILFINILWWRKVQCLLQVLNMESGKENGQLMLKRPELSSDFLGRALKKIFFLLVLQFCAGFCHTTTWISYIHTYIYIYIYTHTHTHICIYTYICMYVCICPSLLSLHLLSPSQHSSLLQSIRQGSHCFTQDSVYMAILLSQFDPPSPSAAVPTSLFSTRFISTIFLNSMYMR